MLMKLTPRWFENGFRRPQFSSWPSTVKIFDTSTFGETRLFSNVIGQKIQVGMMHFING